MGTSMTLFLLPILGMGINVSNTNQQVGDDIRLQQVIDVDENPNNQAVEVKQYHHYYVKEVLVMVIAISSITILASSIGIGIYDAIKRKR